MKRVAAFAGVLLAAMTASPVQAEEAVESIGNRFYVAPMVSYLFGDKDRRSDDGLGGVVAIGRQFNPLFSLEASGTYHGLNTDSDHGKTDIWSGGVSALIFPLEDVLPSLFTSFGVHRGFVNTQPGVDSFRKYRTVFASAGVGHLFGPFDVLNQGSIRAEAVYRMDFHDKNDLGNGGDSRFDDVLLSVGVMIPVGGEAEPIPPADKPPILVVPVIMPVDSDGDGVTDDLDQCPGSIVGEPVDDVGCALPASRCKSGGAGQPVDLQGCATGDTVVLRGVNFDYDKSRLTANARTVLDFVAEALNAAPSLSVEVGGHTDARGGDNYNQQLSERRAVTVRQYLVGKGIDAGRLTSAGYGESRPVADNETDAGRELNRRVELKITGGSNVAPGSEEPSADASAEGS